MNDFGNNSPFEERHFTIRELSKMWRFSEEFVRQIVKDEPGVTEWVRQQPGRRRYRVLRVPQSVAERLYHLLLLGGDKASQGKDIRRAQGFWRDYLEATARGKTK
jgi:hypothetical protein